MSDLQLALGVEAPSIFIVDGKEYKLCPITKGIQADMGEWLKLQAKKELYAMQGDLDDEAFAAVLTRFAEKAAQGRYGFFSPHGQKMMRDVHGPALAHLFYLMMQRYQPKMTEEEATALLRANTPVVTQAINDLVQQGKPQPPAAQKG